jgi:hypothetical protein
VIERRELLATLRAALARSRVVVLVGARQTGKTTLARQLLSPESAGYFDLEDLVSLARLEEPMTALGPLRGLVVIDEVHLRPDLFPVLRVLVDRPEPAARFLILSSASGDLLRRTSESLAGRMERVPIGGFALREVGLDASQRLWRRGGPPLSFLAEAESDSFSWRKSFIQALLERDTPKWGVRVPAVALQRFWTMLAHVHGQRWNATDPARTLGVTESTTRRYLDLLSDALMVRQLQPWHANLTKRQARSPKVYVRDSGLLHQLLGIAMEKDLQTHPKCAASWEGFAIEQVLASEEHDEAFFWATHQGAEIDLIPRRGERLLGIECKRADAPRMSPSIRIARDDLSLAHIAVRYPGSRRYPLADRVEAVPLAELTGPGSIFDAVS